MTKIYNYHVPDFLHSLCSVVHSTTSVYLCLFNDGLSVYMLHRHSTLVCVCIYFFSLLDLNEYCAMFHNHM